MLREILDASEAERKKYAKSFLPKIPNQFNSSFMKALQNDAEMTGMVDQANQLANDLFTGRKDELDALHQQELEQTRIESTQSGFTDGVKQGEIYGKNEGMLEGIIAGWKDASGFKKPYRVYDLSKPSTKPIAVGATAGDLGASIPDTYENRIWRLTTDHMDGKGTGWGLNHWQDVANTKFAYHEDHNRMGINLERLILADPETDLTSPIDGSIAKIVGNGNTVLSSTKKNIKDLVAEATGINIKYPTKPKTGRTPHKPPQTLQILNNAPENTEVDDVTDHPELLAHHKFVDDLRDASRDPDVDDILKQLFQPGAVEEFDNIADDVIREQLGLPAEEHPVESPKKSVKTTLGVEASPVGSPRRPGARRHQNPAEKRDKKETKNADKVAKSKKKPQFQVQQLEITPPDEK
jgi:hypothetical protein